MFYEKIDLYAYCGIERRRSERGFLTVLAPSPCREVKKKLRPAMLVIPGGAYTHVAELEGEPVAVAFMREGYATFLLDYEVCVAYPTPLIQAAMAMRYIRENADTYGIDAKHVCAVGFSAGGHLAGLLSTLYASDDVVRVLGKGCDLCPNAKEGKPSCHSCGGCSSGKSASDADLVSEITKKVMKELGL